MRRGLTLEQAQQNHQPEKLTESEWKALRDASRVETEISLRHGSIQREYSALVTGREGELL